MKIDPTLEIGSFLPNKRKTEGYRRNPKVVSPAAVFVINGKFENQVAILLELLNAQALYAQALTNQGHAFYDGKIAKSALQKAIGELKE